MILILLTWLQNRLMMFNRLWEELCLDNDILQLLELLWSVFVVRPETGILLLFPVRGRLRDLSEGEIRAVYRP